MSVLRFTNMEGPHPSLDFMNNFLSYPNEYLIKKNDEISSNIRYNSFESMLMRSAIGYSTPKSYSFTNIHFATSQCNEIGSIVTNLWHTASTVVIIS